MNFLISATLLSVAVLTTGAILEAPSAKIIQAPSTRTSIVGPDGSAIYSDQPGGRIIAEDFAGSAPLAGHAYAALPLAYARAGAGYAEDRGIVATPIVAAYY